MASLRLTHQCSSASSSTAQRQRRQCISVHCSHPASSASASTEVGSQQGFSRRALLSSATALVPLSVGVSAAQAGPIGEAIASLWRGRQQANRDLILAPIKVAQIRLTEAIQMMDRVMAGQSTGQELAPVLQAVRTSSLNCYVFDASPDDSLETKASLYTQTLQFSDPCTFRLIVKNITGLSPDETRQEGEELVAQLILSYQKLDGELEGAIQGSAESGEAARNQLKTTVAYVNQLEDFVTNILA